MVMRIINLEFTLFIIIVLFFCLIIDWTVRGSDGYSTYPTRGTSLSYKSFSCNAYKNIPTRHIVIINKKFFEEDRRYITKTTVAMPIMKNLGVLSAATTTLAIISFFVFGGFEHQVNSVDHGGKCH